MHGTDSLYLKFFEHVSTGVHTYKDAHLQAVATGASCSSSLKVSPALQVRNSDSSSIRPECRVLLQRAGILCSLTDPLFEVPQDWKSNCQDEKKKPTQLKEMKQTTATLDNSANLAFTSVPAAPQRALSGDYCSHRLCFFTEIKPAYTLLQSVVHLLSIWNNP